MSSHSKEIIASFLCGCSLLSSIAGAQNTAKSESIAGATDAGVPEIIVTANRREQALHAVSLSVSAVSAETLVSKGINNMGEVATGTVPGVIFQQFGGTGSVVGIAVRGVSSGDVSQVTQELPVPIYIDGVYLGRAQGLGLDLMVPERIEVLRGPQGTLFGRNAEGGVVQYITQKPTGRGSADVTGSVGNYGYGRVRGIFNLPAWGDLKVQLGGVYSDRNGFVKNEPAGTLPGGSFQGEERQQRDFNAREAYGVRAAARWEPSDDFTLDYAFDWGRIHETQNYLTYTGPAVGGASAPTTKLPKHSDRALYNGFYHSRTLGHALTAEVRLSDMITLKSITAYRESSRVGYGSTGSALNIAPNFRLPATNATALFVNPHEDNDQNQKSEEIQLFGTWDNFQLTTGAVYYVEKVAATQRQLFISGPGAALLGLPDFRPGARTSQHATSKSLGLYAQASWTPPILSDRLELTAGLRYASDRKTAVRTRGAGDALNKTEVPRNQRSRFSEDRVDPAFTVKYDLSSDANIYVRYAQAYRAGGVSVRSINFDPYGAEVAKSWEAGFKFRTADRRLILNGAVYQNKIFGSQVNTVESDTQITSTTTVNIPETERIRGAELELYYRPISALALGVNYAYSKAKLPPFDNPNTKLVVEQLNLFPLNVPKHTASVTADYRIDTPIGGLVMHVDYAHASKYYTTAGTTSGFLSPKKPSIVRQLNARLTLADLDAGGAKADIALWGKNLLGRDDVVYGFGVAGDRVHSYNYLSDPLTFGLDLRFRI